MLTHIPFSYEIKEKIVQGRNGIFANVKYAVTEIDGKIYWKVLSVQPITELKEGAIHDSRFTIRTHYLPILVDEKNIQSDKQIHQKILSPYISFGFFTSQMTRAPSK